MQRLSDLVEKLEASMPPGKVMLGGEDVTESIRSPAVTESSRFIADSPSVRRRLSAWQRELAATENVVTEGRDQGTLVFPDAFRKYYLTASDEERARRRLADYAARAEPVSFESVLEDIRARDARDAARAIAPMKPAADAIVVDSTGLTVEEVVEKLAADVVGGSRFAEPRDDGAGAGGRVPPSDDRSRGKPVAESRSDRKRAGDEMSGDKPASGKTRMEKQTAESPGRDRSVGLLIWYRFVQYACAVLALVLMRWRAKGQGHVPAAGGVLLVCNHLSFLDVFFVGIPLERPLNYVARSTLFVPLLGMFIRSVGGFPDPARGDRGLWNEGDAEAAQSRRHCDAFSRGDAQQRRRARAAQAGNRRAGGQGGSAGGSGRRRWTARKLAAVAAAAGASSRKDSLRTADHAARAGRPRPPRHHRADPQPHAGGS